MVNINFYSLRLVKEESARYDIDKNVNTPENAYKALKALCEMDKEPEEVLCLLTLNNKNIITGAFEVSRGTLNHSLVHPREIYKRAILNNAASIIIAHNHPSGNPEPSSEDINITMKLKKCGEILDINLVDHIIIGDDKYVSLKERQIL